MKDRISALMDGELDDRAAADLIDALGREREALDTWRAYNLISDAMRETRLLSQGFAARVSAALEKEATVLAPKPRPAARPQPRRWYALAASVAAVALVAWLGFAPQQNGVAPAPMAQAPQPLVAAKTAPAIVPLPSGTNDYLLAHQGFSPRIYLQGMAPYVRTVSEEASR
jgi:sigma-E factor negative regulatory protein RseA